MPVVDWMRSGKNLKIEVKKSNMVSFYDINPGETFLILPDSHFLKVCRKIDDDYCFNAINLTTGEMWNVLHNQQVVKTNACLTVEIL